MDCYMDDYRGYCTAAVSECGLTGDEAAKFDCYSDPISAVLYRYVRQRIH